MNDRVSTFRLNLMRILYAGNFLFVGLLAWKEIFAHGGPWDPLHGVAYSFWAVFTTLMLLGLRHPLKLLPLLLLQFFYKLVWLAAVAFPLWSAGQLAGTLAGELATIFAIGAVVDLSVIPWPHAVRNYLLKSAA